MKINTLSLLPVAIAALDDSSTLLTISTQSSTAANLMNAVGHRNVTTMEALVQELAEESITGVGQFDKDIQDALRAIKEVFVGSIQNALKDQHKADQEHFNCFTKDCFGNCMTTYKNDLDECDDLQKRPCDGDLPGNFSVDHHTCRQSVLTKYQEMAAKCGELHCFEVQDPTCSPEKCTCEDLSNCHKASDGICVSAAGADDCNTAESRKFGTWLHMQIGRYEQRWTDWSALRQECADLYKEFLEEDSACDKTQKEFERCLCDRNQCEHKACAVEYDTCEAQCWARYEKLVDEKECLEKDRKIDWSASKKIECYIDVLLHNFTKEELIATCGKDDCYSTAREEAYKQCEAVCPNIDHDGHWPALDPSSLASANVNIAGHSKRAEKDQFLLGDGEYNCDVNGDQVFTKHRGGAHREGEARCTEHLDIDYQTPQCMACREPPPPVCDAAFHKRWYHQYDEVSTIVHSDACATNCFGPVQQKTSSNGVGELESIEVPEHSEAWGYNRCACTECENAIPKYPGRPAGRQCGMGAHTLSPSTKHPDLIEFKDLCVSAAGDAPALLHVGKDICVKRITLTHKEGQLTCRTCESGLSKWGCDGHSMGLVLASGAQVTAPVFDSTVGMTPHYAAHAHWYDMDGVDGDSTAMAWTFEEPVVFAGSHHHDGVGQYKLWYNEDLTGGTESDNGGRACYDLAMEPAESCHALAPLQFSNICTSAATTHASRTIDLPADTCVTEIGIHWISGEVNCRHEATGLSHFGCDNNMVGLVWTAHADSQIIMPKEGQVKGVRRTDHTQAHWYTMDQRGFGGGRDMHSARTLSMKLNTPLKVPGSLDLWYNEDLTDWTIADNSGTACYEVSVHRALPGSC